MGSKSGDAQVQRVVGTVASDLDNDSLVVDLDVCLRRLSGSVTDVEGTSVVSPERPDVQPLAIRLVKAETPTGYAIEVISGSEEQC